jgi:DNA-nicking Smr family endonuclease
MVRRRRLSPEERRLWEQVAATAAPLHPTLPTLLDADPEPPAPPPAPSPAQRPFRPRPEPPRPEPPRITLDLAPDLLPGPAHPRMDRRRFERLRRGRFDPEARLDLHGMTLEAAHAALTGFILSAHARDLRLLLVITGKGRVPEAGAFPRRHGILRHSVPHWLAAPPLAARVLEVAPAHQRHGGGGAYYVYLRRRR